MDMDKLYDIAAEAVREEELSADDIPAIDLYVDQILNLVADKNKSSSPRYHDRQLTKTMINNYSKDGIITPIKGKKYTKEQIVQILTVYSLKNTLSIGEIKRLLDGIMQMDGYSGEELVRTYDDYIRIKRDNRDYTAKILDELVESNGFSVENDRDYILLIGALLSLSAFLRSTAQAMIDEKYPVPTEEESVEEPKKKEKAKVKEEKPRKERKKKKADAEAREEE